MGITHTEIKVHKIIQLLHKWKVTDCYTPFIFLENKLGKYTNRNPKGPGGSFTFLPTQTSGSLKGTSSAGQIPSKNRLSWVAKNPGLPLPSTSTSYCDSRWALAVPTSGTQCLMIWGAADITITSKVYSKCNALESSQSHSPSLRPWKNCLPWNQSLVPKRLGMADLELPAKIWNIRGWNFSLGVIFKTYFSPGKHLSGGWQPRESCVIFWVSACMCGPQTPAVHHAVWGMCLTHFAASPARP